MEAKETSGNVETEMSGKVEGQTDEREVVLSSALHDSVVEQSRDAQVIRTMATVVISIVLLASYIVPRKCLCG